MVAPSSTSPDYVRKLYTKSKSILATVNSNLSAEQVQKEALLNDEQAAISIYYLLRDEFNIFHANLRDFKRISQLLADFQNQAIVISKHMCNFIDSKISTEEGRSALTAEEVKIIKDVLALGSPGILIEMRELQAVNLMGFVNSLHDFASNSIFVRILLTSLEIPSYRHQFIGEILIQQYHELQKLDNAQVFPVFVDDMK